MQLIGIDTGGTFTDVVVVAEDGSIGVGKALSTPGQVEVGVFDALTRAAGGRGMTLSELLRGTNVLAHGTTVGLNALLTGTGARVGLITTRGFESTLPIARANKVHGLAAVDVRTPARWRSRICSSAAAIPGASAAGSMLAVTCWSRWTRTRRGRPSVT